MMSCLLKTGGGEHSLIIGDNYDALLNLLITHRNKIDVIYIDPPYGANSMGEFADTNYENSITRDNLLSMLYPRLMLAKDLLTNKGVIFCSIDDRNYAYLKCLFDEVFGEANFISSLIITSNSSKNNADYIGDIHEYVLCYAKNINAVPKGWQVKKNNVEEFQKRAKQLVARGLSEEDIHKELLELVKYPRFYDFDHYTYADKRGVFRPDNIGGVPNGNMDTELIHPLTGGTCSKPSGGFRYKEEELKRMIEEDRILFGKDESTIPQVKRYLADYLTQTPKSVSFFDSQSSTKWLKANGLNFDFPKAVNLMKYIVSLYPDKDITVLDFFAGSATTGHAVVDLNKEDGGSRQFILCTNNEIDDKNPNGIAYDVSVPRLAKAMKEDSLSVYDIKEISKRNGETGHTPFDVIDEECYGLDRFENIQDKIVWVCENFEGTCKTIKEDK